MNSKDKLSKPYASGLAVNREWTKVMKALDNSINIAVLFPLFRLLFKFSIIFSNACCVLWLLQSPVRHLENLWLVSLDEKPYFPGSGRSWKAQKDQVNITFI